MAANAQKYNQKLISAVGRSMGVDGSIVGTVTLTTDAPGTADHVSVAPVFPIWKMVSTAGSDQLTLLPGYYSGHEVTLLLGTDGGGDVDISLASVAQVTPPHTHTITETVTGFETVGDYVVVVWDGDSWQIVLSNDLNLAVA